MHLAQQCVILVKLTSNGSYSLAVVLPTSALAEIFKRTSKATPQVATTHSRTRGYPMPRQAEAMNSGEPSDVRMTFSWR